MQTTRTLHKNHPIQEVVFSIEFKKLMDEATLTRLALLKEPFKNELPKVDEFRSPIFAARPDGITIQTPNNVLAGISFQHLRESGAPDWIVSAAQNNITIRCLDYIGWAKVWPKARNYIETMCDIIAETNQIITINIQYINRFICSNVEAYSWKDVFKEGTPYLTEKVKKAGASWHIFQGWLDKDAIIECEYISNLNLATSIENNEHYTSVNLFRQAKIGNGDYNVDKIMNQLHLDIKAILSDVITTQWIEEIGLNQ